jgi:hypothetical protein
MPKNKNKCSILRGKLKKSAAFCRKYVPILGKNILAI